MHLLVALALLVAAGLTLVATTWAARWAAGLAFGRRSAVDAIKPWADVGYPLGFARAVAGTMGWYLGASLLAILPLVLMGEERVDESSMRVHVVAGGPASRAGLVDGDRIIGVDGAPVHDWQALEVAIASHADTPAHVEVERSGARMAFDVVPEDGRIRVVPPVHHVDADLGKAVAQGLAQPARVVVLTGASFLGIFGGTERVEASGPVGIVKNTTADEHERFGQSLALDAVLAAYVLPLVLLVSLALAFAARRKVVSAAR